MIYLDNGATSFPKPPGMLLAMDKCMQEYCGNPGRSGHNMSRRTGEEVYRARRTLAELFNIREPERLIFTRNATEAINMGIKGLLKAGDHIVTTSMEHNSVLRPLEFLHSIEPETEYSVVEGDKFGFVAASKIGEAIRSNTKMVICTHASNVTGTIMPIREIGEIAAEKGILFMVDGAQSAGCIPIDVEEMKIDLLALPGHKGLLGPLGTGALYAGKKVGKIEPLMHGGTGTASGELTQPREFPEGYESGTVNAPGIIGLGYSAKLISDVGVEEIGRHEKKLTDVLYEELSGIRSVRLYGPEPCKSYKGISKVGIVTFNIEKMSSEDAARLLNDRYDIAVRAGYHCAGLAHKTIGTWETGAVRVSVGPFNTLDDIQKTVAAVRQMAAGMI